MTDEFQVNHVSTDALVKELVKRSVVSIIAFSTDTDMDSVVVSVRGSKAHVALLQTIATRMIQDEITHMRGQQETMKINGEPDQLSFDLGDVE